MIFTLVVRNYCETCDAGFYLLFFKQISILRNFPHGFDVLNIFVYSHFFCVLILTSAVCIAYDNNNVDYDDVVPLPFESHYRQTYIRL